MYRIRHHVLGKYHERRLRIASCRTIHVPSIHNTTTYFACESVDYQSLIKILDGLYIEKNKDVFVDLGSGTGRAVIVAATYPFRKVIGVELSTELNCIAEKNLVRARKRLKCKDVQFITADACHYEIPTDVRFVFIFSPFGQESISMVLGNIRKSLSQSPRKLNIIYVNPRIFENVIQNNNWVTKRREIRRRDNIRIVVYESV